MLHVENMTPRDFEFAVRLTDTMNWKLAAEDFEFIMKLEPKGCLVLFDDAERIGIVTVVSFGRIGWLGNLIVAESHREKGAGSLLARHSVNYLTSKGVRTVGLYAYTDKIPFYNRLGFEYDSEFAVLVGEGFSSTEKPDLSKARKEDMREIVEFDKTCFGDSREKLLNHILLNRSNQCYMYTENGKMIGYAATKVYEDMAELGPLVCRRGRTDVAIALLEANLNNLEGLEVSLCMPKKESSIINVLTESGFAEDFRVARMFFKPQTVKDCVYVAESLERG